MTIYNHQAEETDTENQTDVFKLPLKVMSFIFQYFFLIIRKHQKEIKK